MEDPGEYEKLQYREKAMYPQSEEPGEKENGEEARCGDPKWTILPHIVCAEHPDRVLYQGYPAHAETIMTDPEKLREVFHSLTHEELEVIATCTALYQYFDAAKARQGLINLAGTLAKKDTGQLLTRTLAEIFHVKPKHIRKMLREDLKAKDYREIAIRRWKKEAKPNPPSQRIL
jgi:hypothetical protein